MNQLGIESGPCPYCGGQGGNHLWAGGGGLGCPGAAGIQGQYGVSDTEMRILAQLAAIRAELEGLKQLMERLNNKLF
jgi:hypothetical protein